MTISSDELKELLANATPGPWSVCTTEGQDARSDGFDILGSCISGVTWIEPYDCEDTARANARLIALAPQLAAEVVKLQAEVGRLQAEMSILLWPMRTRGFELLWNGYPLETSRCSMPT